MTECIQEAFHSAAIFRVAKIDNTKFDRVFVSLVPPAIWLAATELVIRQSQAIRQESARLQRESREVQEHSSRQRARSRKERERNKDAGGLWKLDH